MLVGCDYVISFMLGSNLALMMYKVGDKCEIIYILFCFKMENVKCEMKEVEECLEDFY